MVKLGFMIKTLDVRKMISDDEDDNNIYPLFNGTVCDKSGFLDAGQMGIPVVSLSSGSDNSWGVIVSESFDSSAFLCSSTSDDIANYNFLEPLLPMLDDAVTGDTEPASPADYVDTRPSVAISSSRTSYHFDPVSLSIVRCVSSSPNLLTLPDPGVTAATDSESTKLSSSNQPNVVFDDELDTFDITRRVNEELRRCNISQALFAHAVLGRSQGTLSDLLRKPKPWAQLKSGRDTFVKMQQWLMEPEKQRLASLTAIDTDTSNQERTSFDQ